MRCSERLRAVTAAAPTTFAPSAFPQRLRQPSAVAELGVVRRCYACPMIRAIKKRLAIRGYRTSLAACLERRNGWRANYSPKQVRDCALITGASLDYLCFAYAIHCTRDDFNAHHATTGETCDGHACDYDAMRSEVSSVESSGDTGSHSGDSGGGWFGSYGDCGGGDSGGGDGGGGGGGD
jgi:uncharacterized membrane protein YgcG